MAAHGPVASPDEIDRALTTLAHLGSAGRAAAVLGMNPRTLNKWRAETHRDRYLEIAEREAPKIEAIAAQQAREIVIRANEAEHDLLDALSQVANDPSQSKTASELAGALQRVTTSKGISTTKLLELTGRPTSIVEHRDPTTTAQSLARKLGIVFDATAEDVTTVPLIPGSSDANARVDSGSSAAD